MKIRPSTASHARWSLSRCEMAVGRPAFDALARAAVSSWQFLATHADVAALMNWVHERGGSDRATVSDAGTVRRVSEEPRRLDPRAPWTVRPRGDEPIQAPDAVVPLGDDSIAWAARQRRDLEDVLDGVAASEAFERRGIALRDRLGDGCSIRDRRGVGSQRVDHCSPLVRCRFGRRSRTHRSLLVVGVPVTAEPSLHLRACRNESPAGEHLRS